MTEPELDLDLQGNDVWLNTLLKVKPHWQKGRYESVAWCYRDGCIAQVRSAYLACMYHLHLSVG